MHDVFTISLLFTICSSYFTKLKVGLSKFHLRKVRHNVRDAINPMCSSNKGIESTERSSLLCPSFAAQRRHLLPGDFALIRPFEYMALSNELLTPSFVDKDPPSDVNRNIPE